eukprot:1972056-Pleurochrysis_carterae.AAC.1
MRLDPPRHDSTECTTSSCSANYKYESERLKKKGQNKKERPEKVKNSLSSLCIPNSMYTTPRLWEAVEAS